MAREPFNRIWTETPTVDDFDEPTEAMWDEGWRGGADQDPPEAFAQNWWQNRADFALQDIERLGAMSYEETAEYEIGGRAIGSDGKRYRSITIGNVGNDPVTDGGVNWAEDPDLSLATPAETSSGSLDDHAVTPLGLLTGMMGAADLSESGYAKIPVNISGSRVELVIQWGDRSVTSAQDSATITLNFPIAFPNSVFSIVPIDRSNDSNAFAWTLNGPPTTTSAAISFKRLIGTANTNGFRWIAIGY